MCLRVSQHYLIENIKSNNLFITGHREGGNRQHHHRGRGGLLVLHRRVHRQGMHCRLPSLVAEMNHVCVYLNMATLIPPLFKPGC